MNKIGMVTHYFAKIQIGVIELTGNLSVGDKISIKGSTTNFVQIVDSMQMDHKRIEKASAGDAIGLKVKEPIRENDQVFKVEEE